MARYRRRSLGGPSSRSLHPLQGDEEGVESLTRKASFSPRFARQFRRLPKDSRLRQDIGQAIKLYVETGQGNAVPVRGARYGNLWRLKVKRDWRVLFRKGAEDSVEFIGFGRRKDIYRNL